MSRYNYKKRKVGGIRYEARSRGRSSPDTRLFEPAKRPDDRADYCLDCSILPQWKHRVIVFTLTLCRCATLAGLTLIRITLNWQPKTIVNIG